jgi:GT2 family glycosyltransferase
VLLSESLSRRVVRGEVELSALAPTDWLRLRMTGDVNKLTHLLYWPTGAGRVQTRFRWKGIRSCNFGVWYRDFEAVNGFDETFSGWGHEDADLVLRLHHHGCRRKNGFLATEVFHLWHPENSRQDEAGNRDRVVRRIQGDLVRAEQGLAELARGCDAVVTELNER